MKQKKIKIIVSTIIMILALVFGIKVAELVENPFAEEIKIAENSSEKLYEVLKVVDGDTIQIEFNGKKERVRLIGIDTPESVHPDETKNTENGKKASEYTKLLLEGKSVSLEFDVEERDKYGRLLAYVYLDKEMINKKLLADGYAQLETVPPNVKYVDEFTTVLEEAKKEKRGLWNEK